MGRGGRPGVGVFLALALAPALSGCLDQFRPEGEESLTILNGDDRVVEVIVRIQTVDGQIPMFSEGITLPPGAAREYALALRPGDHILALTTSTKVDERFHVEIPTRGDTRWTITVTASGATLGRSA